MAQAVQIGLISDTHGLLRPQAVAHLRGVSLILHAGDIGAPEVLDELGSVARVVAVRGNNDRDAWARAIPERQVIDFSGLSIWMLHDANDIGNELTHLTYDVVVTGHSHRARVERRGEMLFVNPGSAGPRRFRLPVTVARLTIEDKAVHAHIIELQV